MRLSDYMGTPTQIGVSIGTSSIKIAELKKNGKKGYTLVHFGVAQLQDEAIVNREIVNHMAVVDALKGLVTQLKLKGRSVVTCVSGPSVIIKKILLEQTSNRELPDAILWEAEQYVPFDINEIVYDFQVLNQFGAEGKMEIMLVACKKNVIEGYQAALKDAGLKSSIFDVDLFALQNAFEANYPFDGAVALVDIGAASLKLVICINGQPVFTRDSTIGGRTLTAEIQKHLNVSYQEAELLKIDGASQAQLPQEVADLMQVTAENIASEVKRSVDFYTASNTGTPITQIFLSGGSSQLPNLQKMIEDSLGISVQPLDPFVSISHDQKIFTEDYLKSVTSIASIPIGLALRGFG